MNKSSKTNFKGRQRRWVLFSNGCVHGVQHSEVVVLESKPRTMVRSSVSVVTLSRAFGMWAAVGLVTLLIVFLAACQLPRSQKGGAASTRFNRPGRNDVVTLTQSENPREASRQTMDSEQTVEYVLPPGSAIGFGAGQAAAFETNGASGACLATVHRATPVRMTTRDRVETSIGGAQKDSIREWTVKAANMQPVMWAGVIMMTLVAGALVYFGWWTKAGLAVGVGLGMIVLAQTLPDRGGMILLGGLGVFSLAALLVLYSYYKGQLDKDRDGIPDVLQKNRDVAI